LRQQAAVYQNMQPQDVYKMLYQAVYGAEHLLQDKNAAWEYFRKEYASVVPEDMEEPLWEQIGEEIYRVNLRAWKKRNLPEEWLFRLFVGSVEMMRDFCPDVPSGRSLCEKNTDAGVNREKEREFAQGIEIAGRLAKENVFAFSYEDFMAYSREYEKEGPRAVHHSEKYRLSQHPSYRLVNARFLRLIPLLEQMGRLKNEGRKKVIIAIDGRCASGKSTMARMLSYVVGAGVIHMDDFYLPMEMRTKERLGQPGGNVHRERFWEEVMPGLEGGEDFSYRRFDCRKMELGETRKVPKAWAYVVEGAYSHHPGLGDYADIRVFSHVEYEEQLRRIEARDGGQILSMFQERWIPLEEKYFAAYSVREKADMIV